MMRWLRQKTAWLLIGCIDAYRLVLSPWLGRSCRFEPTCSTYAKEAILVHGPFIGVWLSIKRLGRCHPLHPGGYDPVPTPTQHSSDQA